MKNLTHIFIIALTTIQTAFGQTAYPSSELNGTSASCKSCSVSNSSKAVGADMTDYSTIKVAGSAKNASYSYQNLFFTTTQSASTEINFIISSTDMSVLTKTDIQNIEFYTLLNNISNKDSITGDNTTISQIGTSGKYLISFFSKNVFNGIGIEMNTRDNKEEEKALRVYGAYYNYTPLPVELLSFTGKNEVIGNVLNWVTASEENNSGFIIEKSVDGKIFTAIGNVNGQGTTENTTEYSFTDVTVKGTLYYRLKQLDLNGTVAYSQVISLSNIVKEGLTIMSANPFETSVLISFNTSIEVTLEISIIDMRGNTVYQHSTISNDGYNELNLGGLDNLQTGVYTLVVIAGNNTLSARIIK